MSLHESTGVIEKRVLIQASPAVIYRALTDAREIERWFCDRVTSDPKVGGELKAYWKMGPRQGRAVFTALIPDSRVELQWVDDETEKTQAAASHSILYTIRLKRASTEVTVRDAGPPTDEETFAALNEGWIELLRSLKEHCEARQRSSRSRATRASGEA
jgi:uncharacterized protein YndB with AHSA1/START domain